jgi:hypothetical protein
LAIFQSADHFYAVMQEVFEHVGANPANIAAFTRSNLVIRITTSNPDAEILLDGRQPPLEVFYGPRPGKANLEVRMEANLLHAIWLGEESASQAFFNQRVKTKGNFMKAMQLIDLFRECERVYPTVVAKMQLDKDE